MNDPIKIDVVHLICQYCNTFYKSMRALRVHFKSNLHDKNVKKSSIVYDLSFAEPRTKDYYHKHWDENIIYFYDKTLSYFELCNVPLKNGTSFTINKYVWDLIQYYTISHDNRDIYPHIFVNDKIDCLHLYIYYEIFKNIPIKGYHVDHKNREKLDVSIENLRQIPPGINRNGTKMKKCTSIYKGYLMRRLPINGDVNFRLEINHIIFIMIMNYMQRIITICWSLKIN